MFNAVEDKSTNLIYVLLCCCWRDLVIVCPRYRDRVSDPINIDYTRWALCITHLYHYCQSWTRSAGSVTILYFVYQKLKSV